jgi:hypothetical protein
MVLAQPVQQVALLAQLQLLVLHAQLVSGSMAKPAKHASTDVQAAHQPLAHNAHQTSAVLMEVHHASHNQTANNAIPLLENVQHVTLVAAGQLKPKLAQQQAQSPTALHAVNHHQPLAKVANQDFTTMFHHVSLVPQDV